MTPRKGCIRYDNAQKVEVPPLSCVESGAFAEHKSGTTSRAATATTHFPIRQAGRSSGTALEESLAAGAGSCSRPPSRSLPILLLSSKHFQKALRPPLASHAAVFASCVFFL